MKLARAELDEWNFSSLNTSVGTGKASQSYSPSNKTKTHINLSRSPFGENETRWNGFTDYNWNGIRMRRNCTGTEAVREFRAMGKQEEEKNSKQIAKFILNFAVAVVLGCRIALAFCFYFNPHSITSATRQHGAGQIDDLVAWKANDLGTCHSINLFQLAVSSSLLCNFCEAFAVTFGTV